MDDVQEKIGRLVRKAKKVGLKVNVRKTKVLRLNCPESRKICIRGEELGEVEEFCNLGGFLTGYGRSVEDMAGRLQKARDAFENLRTVWSSREISVKIKLLLYSNIVDSTLLYRCECWTMAKGLEKRLQVFQRRCLRIILRLFYSTLTSNANLLQRSGQRGIILKVVDRKWRWIGHIARKEPESPVWRMEGVRRKGRPRETWKRTASRELHEATGLQLDDVVTHAQDQKAWRRLVDSVRTFTRKTCYTSFIDYCSRHFRTS